ncbi:MAG: hypothetical protein K2X99_11130 [Gemmatimonadaceae bacterium]|nr:hypothetical protein [Gemmatimonadaceae bacterium]
MKRIALVSAVLVLAACGAKTEEAAPAAEAPAAAPAAAPADSSAMKADTGMKHDSAAAPAAEKKM